MSDEPKDPRLESTTGPELEARVVAWVLGEASAFEAAELERVIAEKPELAIFKRRIEAVHGLVGEATGADWKPLRLAPERRQKLLAAVGLTGGVAANQGAAVAVIRQAAAKKSRKPWRVSLLEVAAVLMLIGVLAAIMIPTVGSSPEAARRNRDEQAVKQAELAGLFKGDRDMVVAGVPAMPPSGPVAAPAGGGLDTLTSDSPFRGGRASAAGGRRGGGGGGGAGGGPVFRNGVATVMQNQGHGVADTSLGYSGGGGGGLRGAGGGAGFSNQNSARESETVITGGLTVGMAMGAPTTPTVEEKLAATNAEAKGLSARISQQLGGSAGAANALPSLTDQFDLTNPTDTAPPGAAAPVRPWTGVWGGEATAPAQANSPVSQLAQTAARAAAPTDFKDFLSFSNDDRTNSLVVDGGALGYNKLRGSISYSGQITGANTFAPAIADGLGGATSLVKNGVGEWVLAGNNTYTGVTSITGGTLSTGLMANGGVASSIGASSNAASNLVLNGGALQYAGSKEAESTDRLFTLGAGGGVLDASGTSTISFARNGSGAANASAAGTGRTLTFSGTNVGHNTQFPIISDGTGTLALNGVNTYTGGTTVTNGTLAVTGGGFLLNGGANMNRNLSDAISNVDPTLTDEFVLGNPQTWEIDHAASSPDRLARSRTPNTVVNVSRTLTTGAASDTKFAGAIGGTGALTVEGSGDLALTPASDAGFGSSYNLGGGTVNAVLAGAGGMTLTGSNTLLGTGAVTVAGGDLNLGTAQTVGTVTLTSGSISGATLTGSSYILANGSISAALAGSSAVTVSGSTVMLSGANTRYTGSTTISSGTRAISSRSGLTDRSEVTSTGALSVLDSDSIKSLAGSGLVDLGGTLATGAAGRFFAGNIGGTQGTMVVDGGSLVLSGANTFTGTTTVNAGTLALGASGALNAGDNLTVAGGTLDVQNPQVWNGNFAFQASNSPVINGGVVTNARGTTVAYGSSAAQTISGVISGSGSLAVNKNGTGTWGLSGASNYTGSTTVLGGTLSIGADNALGAVPAPPASSITLNGGTLSTTASFALSANRGITLGTGGGSLDVAKGTSTTVGGIIAGGGSLVRRDAGTVVLSNAANTYTGTTMVQNGGLVAGSSGLTKTGGGTLSLSGANTFTGGVLVNGGRLVLKGSGDGAFAGNVSGNLGLVKTGAGNLPLSGTNSYQGGTFINGGSLVVGSASKGGSGALTLTTSGSFDGGTLQLAGTGTTAYGGALTDSPTNISSTTGLLVGMAVNSNLGGSLTTTGSNADTGGGGLTSDGEYKNAPLVNLGFGVPPDSSSSANKIGRTAYAVQDEGVKAKVNVRQPAPGDQPNLVTTGSVLGSFTHSNGAADDRLNIDKAMIQFDTNNKPVENTVTLFDVPAPAAAPPAAAPADQKQIATMIAKARSQYLGGNLAGAEDTFKDVVSLDPRSPEAIYFLNRISNEIDQTAVNAREEYAKRLIREVDEAFVPPSVVNAPAAAPVPPPPSNTSLEYLPITKATLSRMTGAAGAADGEAAALQKFFQSAGVDFSGVNGSALAYNGSTLVINQTPQNIDRIRNILARYSDIKQVQIETKLVEVSNDNQAGAATGPTAAQKEANAKRAAAAAAAAERAKTLAEISDADIKTADETYSTFSLHVSDVSFKLALAALAKGEKPDPASVRAEEFYNAFDYGDPSPAPGEPVACRIEQSAHPVLQQRNLVRIALRVPATGRDAAQPLRLTVLLDSSGSMERADRAACVHAALASLASLLGPNDVVTLIGFARTPRLLAQQLPGSQAAKLVALTANLPFEGGTNLEEALKLAGEEARRQQVAGAQNRIVLLTDGAANLGDADPEQLAKQIVALRQQGITLDACGVVASGLDDGILEALTRKGDGRYYLLNAPEDADAGFARQLAGAFHPAAENVKVQVHFNPARVASYRLIGFEANRLTTEDFHNDAVTAAQLASEEAAVALYQVEVLPQGDGEIGDVSVRFRETATGNMIERTWTILDDPAAKAFDQASPTMQLAGTAAMLAEKLRGGAVASLFRLETLAPTVNALRGEYANEPRVQDLATMFGEMRRMFGE